MTIQQIAEAFSRHDFVSTYPYLSETIQWNLIGSQLLTGTQSIIAACEQSSAYLKTVTTTFDKFLILSTENDIVIDSLSTYADGEQLRTKVASCDWYRFENGKLAEITSYTIEVNE
ncbi:nuclear transport factor 2-like protein [Spirosoma endbachense]|uniref:Nuclear transport factor 2 family protein n=1 Tax=Spirosoma endbachense TaxID=2666025 RepID=A0A6P1W1G5_9BACT|nr:nuclear transport factor 2 family protein [Spirosoma endbachense]QHV98152.1 nuclear transport factor 2 family protein [Spirosoma endbachense]